MAARSTLLVTSTVAVLMSSRAAFANMAAPFSRGEVRAEPAGIADVAILHEDLFIDLRPLSGGNRLVAVSATYRLDNRAGDKHLDLVFASGARDLTNIRVTLDGATVPTRSRRGVATPRTWDPPARTPLPDGRGSLPYEVDPRDDSGGFALDFDCARGAHQLAITYLAEAGSWHTGDPTVVRQFAYVLAPARAWAGFGGLDVAIHVPHGWRAASEPPLTREGDVLHGTFPSVPADALAVAIQAPANAFYVVRALALAALAIITVGGWRFIRHRALAHLRDGARPSRLGVAALGLAWSGLFFVAGCLAIRAPDWVLPDDSVSDYGYGAPMAFLAVMGASPVLFVLAILLALRAPRQAGPAAPSPPT